MFLFKYIEITDMMFDWIANLLGWIETSTSSIRSFSVDSQTNVAIYSSLQQPTSLTVNPYSGYANGRFYIKTYCLNECALILCKMVCFMSGSHRYVNFSTKKKMCFFNIFENIIFLTISLFCFEKVIRHN